MKKLILTMTLAFLTTSALAAQCPSIKNVLVKGQWQTPKGWKTFKLSPLANDTGQKMVSQQGLMHVFYLKNTKQLRCVYNKVGTSVAKNTYIVTQHLDSLTPVIKNRWSVMMGNVVACVIAPKKGKPGAIKPTDCQWQ